MSKSGKILISADLGDEYGFVDVDGMYFIILFTLDTYILLNLFIC